MIISIDAPVAAQAGVQATRGHEPGSRPLPGREGRLRQT